jgi:DNA-binding response OmpR family regulator
MGARASMPPPASTTVLKGCRVLVVEDEALIAMMLEDVLREAGAEVLTAATLGEALRLVEAATAGHGGGLGAAVLDIDLAGEKVLPVADALARLGVPFLFATGYDAGCDRGGHAAAPLLRKPYDPLDLIAALAALLRGEVPPQAREVRPAPASGLPLGGGQTSDRGSVRHPVTGPR